jgi:transposase
MSARQSAAVDKALKLVAKGMTPYAAAKKVGIALSTIYRAIYRQKPTARSHKAV